MTHWFDERNVAILEARSVLLESIGSKAFS